MPSVQRERRDKRRYGQGLLGCRPIRSLSDMLLHAAMHVWDGERKREKGHHFSSRSLRGVCSRGECEQKNERNGERHKTMLSKNSYISFTTNFIRRRRKYVYDVFKNIIHFSLNKKIRDVFNRIYFQSYREKTRRTHFPLWKKLSYM